ncbi:MAG: LysE family translocator [Candidatus Taylorbacteria bacterium]|nr:LysE family translocator [Candidatus Taylorbacteria bacterium]
MNFLPEFFAVAAIHLLAVMSPGPDFVLISRNSLVYSRKVGVFSAVGLGLGILVHVTYSFIGIGLIISKSIILFSIIKYLGAGYLIYVGYKCIRTKPSVEKIALKQEQKELSPIKAIRMGFLTNALNPKATLFFLALFTQIISPTTPKFIQVLYGLEMSLMTFAWFTFVSVVLSNHRIKSRFVPLQHYFERFFGATLVALGIKVALSTPGK